MNQWLEIVYKFGRFFVKLVTMRAVLFTIPTVCYLVQLITCSSSDEQEASYNNSWPESCSSPQRSLTDVSSEPLVKVTTLRQSIRHPSGKTQAMVSAYENSTKHAPPDSIGINGITIFHSPQNASLTFQNFQPNKIFFNLSEKVLHQHAFVQNGPYKDIFFTNLKFAPSDYKRTLVFVKQFEGYTDRIFFNNCRFERDCELMDELGKLKLKRAHFISCLVPLKDYLRRGRVDLGFEVIMEGCRQLQNDSS